MSTMDYKGIAWVGNIYEKFEAMCLEVEETMYQDTAKYVENQVQTVGASVKKFYSDVMQDLLPPSSIDPAKVAVPDVGIHKKSKASIKEDTLKVDKLLTEDSRVIAGLDADHKSSVNGLLNVNHVPPPNSRGSTKEAYFELYSGKNKDGEIYGHSIVCIERNSKKKNHPPSEKSISKNTGSEDRSRASLCFEMSKNDEAACQQIAISPRASVEVSGCTSRDEEEEGKILSNIMDANVPADVASIDFPTSSIFTSIESNGKEGTKLRSISSSAGLSTEFIETCTNSGMVSQMGSYVNGDTQYNQSAGEVVSMSHSGKSGDCNTDVIENDDNIEPRMETIEQYDNSKLEETCILVDGDRLSFVSHTKGKHRSYKKKIREALSLKKRSARKQEYEQLAARYGDSDTESNLERAEFMSPTVTMDSNAQKLPANDCESEWELL